MDGLAPRGDIAPDFQTLHEVVRAARRALPDSIWGYLIGGADTETTLLRNRHALDSVAFRPRVLRDVSAVDPRHRFLGQELRLPVLLAPIGGLESMEPGGAATVVRAAHEARVPAMVSSVTLPGLEEAAAAAPAFRIFQLYVRGDDAWIDDHGARAIAAGYAAFCFTVDTAVYSRRERDIAGRFDKPWRRRVTGHEFQAGLTWRQIERFRARHDIPVILKGIATAEDAAIACDHGVDAVYVSNHGGRQLDHGRGAIDALPEVVEAVRGRARVIVDGGICRGADVVKAMALGADLVGIGRLYAYGLAADGVRGIARVLSLLEEEIRGVMGLLGIAGWDQLDPSLLHRGAAPMVPPHVFSAFPLLSSADVPAMRDPGPMADHPAGA